MLNFIIGLTWMLASIMLALIHYFGLFGGVRTRQGLIAFLACSAAFLGLGYYMWAEQQQKAIAAGYESTQDRRNSEKAGFTNAEAWKAEKLKRSSQDQK